MVTWLSLGSHKVCSGGQRRLLLPGTVLLVRTGCEGGGCETQTELLIPQVPE